MELYYLCSENKGVDQLRSYAFIFAYAKCWFSHDVVQFHLYNSIHALIRAHPCYFWQNIRQIKGSIDFNPYNMMNRISHHYHLGQSTSIIRDTRSDFEFLFLFSMKFLLANRKAPDGTPRSAASHLELFCLPMSHKKDARLILVKMASVVTVPCIVFLISKLLSL